MIEVFHSSPNQTNKTKDVRLPRGNLSANLQPNMRKTHSNHEHQSGSDQHKSKVVDEARTTGAKVHFASLLDICHLKKAELEAKHQKYKGRVVLRGDLVKDGSGSYAVFTEQGSSASQMTAAKIMDIISRLPGCDGQAADAVSAYTQVKWKMLTNY